LFKVHRINHLVSEFLRNTFFVLASYKRGDLCPPKPHHYSEVTAVKPRLHLGGNTMQNSKKSKESELDPENTDQSDTIILSTEDESMPAALAVDENGLLDIDKLNADKSAAVEDGSEQQNIDAAGNTPGTGADPSPEKPGFNPLNKLLAIFRIPERWLVNLYYNSTVRKVLCTKYDWYREFEGTQEIHNKLENMYGGSYKILGSSVHFVRNNVLVTLTLVALSGQLFVDYLSQPAQNRYVDNGNSAGVDDTLARASSAVAAGPNEAELLHNLNHCAVSDDLRQVYYNQKNKSLRTSVLTEVSGFIETYGDSDLENWFVTRAAKRDVAISYIQATLPGIKNYSVLIADELAAVVAQHADISGTMKSINVTTKPGINEFIRMRGELIRLEDQIRYGPTITKTISTLDRQILRLKKIFTGFKEEPNAVRSRWAVNTSQQDPISLTNTIGAIIRQDIDANIDDPSTDTPETKLYKLQILAATLRDFGDLITHLGEYSNNTVIRVAETQNSSNNRLRELLGVQENPELIFLNYDNCLFEPNSTSPKLTIR